jgi:hypothetical protein
MAGMMLKMMNPMGSMPVRLISLSHIISLLSIKKTHTNGA